MYVCVHATHACAYTNTTRYEFSDFQSLFLLLRFPLCNKNVNWNIVCQEICDYLCVWVWMRVWTLCVFVDLRAFPIILPHILASICKWFRLSYVYVCVWLWQLCDAEVESSARKVINFYLLWQFNCNFTNNRTHANLHTRLVKRHTKRYRDTRTQNWVGDYSLPSHNRLWHMVQLVCLRFTCIMWYHYKYDTYNSLLGVCVWERKMCELICYES